MSGLYTSGIRIPSPPEKPRKPHFLYERYPPPLSPERKFPQSSNGGKRWRFVSWGMLSNPLAPGQAGRSWGGIPGLRNGYILNTDWIPHFGWRGEHPEHDEDFENWDKGFLFGDKQTRNYTSRPSREAEHTDCQCPLVYPPDLEFEEERRQDVWNSGNQSPQSLYRPLTPKLVRKCKIQTSMLGSAPPRSSIQSLLVGWTRPLSMGYRDAPPYSKYPSPYSSSIETRYRSSGQQHLHTLMERRFNLERNSVLAPFMNSREFWAVTVGVAASWYWYAPPWGPPRSIGYVLWSLGWRVVVVRMATLLIGVVLAVIFG